MKKDIHPEYQECKVTCVCGNTFTTRSTLKEIDVEICSECHPFFTGQQKLIDSAGRVDRFLKKYGKDYGGKDEKPTEEPAGGDEPAEDKKPAAQEGTDESASDEEEKAEG